MLKKQGRAVVFIDRESSPLIITVQKSEHNINVYDFKKFIVEVYF